METNREVTYRKVPSLLFLYEISEDGRYFRNVKSKRVLRQFKDQHGYYFVQPVVHGHKRIVKVHRLVAECWLGPSDLQVDHIDRDKTNNHYSNLRYCTNQQNCLNKDFTNTAKANKVRLGNTVTVDDTKFESFTDAARYIADLHSKSFNTVRKYLKSRRNYIYGHKISYCRD